MFSMYRHTAYSQSCLFIPPCPPYPKTTTTKKKAVVCNVFNRYFLGLEEKSLPTNVYVEWI